MKERIEDYIWSHLEKVNIIKDTRWDFIDENTGDAFRLKEKDK